MDPVSSASSAIPMLERGGVVAAVVLCAAVCLAGLTVAVYILWKTVGKKDSELDKKDEKFEKIQREHYQWTVNDIRQRQETDKKIADALSSQAAVLSALQAALQVVVVLLTNDQKRPEQ